MFFQLYPRTERHASKMKNENSSVANERKTRPTTRYLRSRNAVVPVESSLVAQSTSGVSAGNALVTVSHGNSGNSDIKPIHSYALMIDGKALLDPSIALRSKIMTSQSHSVSSSGANDETASDLADVPQMSMLLPTSSIRWGQDWSESIDGTTSALLAGLKLNHGDGFKFPEESDTNDMYIELVCSIMSAQLVKNVTTSYDM